MKSFSPVKQTRFEVKSAAGQLLYLVSNNKQWITDWSKLGFVINDRTGGANEGLINKKYTVQRARFAWRLDEDDPIFNDYKQLILKCRSNNSPFNLIARANNGNVDSGYKIPAQEDFSYGAISREPTRFVFTKSLSIYQYNQESVFTPLLTDSLKRSCNLPDELTGYYRICIGIGDADNEDYTKTEITKCI